jgi:hypothetical protein
VIEIKTLLGDSEVGETRSGSGSVSASVSNGREVMRHERSSEKEAAFPTCLPHSHPESLAQRRRGAKAISTWLVVVRKPHWAETKGHRGRMGRTPAENAENAEGAEVYWEGEMYLEAVRKGPWRS